MRQFSISATEKLQNSYYALWDFWQLPQSAGPGVMWLVSTISVTTCISNPFWWQYENATLKADSRKQTKSQKLLTWPFILSFRAADAEIVFLMLGNSLRFLEHNYGNVAHPVVLSV